MSRERYAREARRKIAEVLEQTAEVVRLGEFEAAVQAVEFAGEMVRRLRDEFAKPELSVVGGGGGGSGGGGSGGAVNRS